MAKSPARKSPAGLGVAGRRLWRECDAAVPRTEERTLLLEACRTADELDRMTKALAKEPPTVDGSMGQPVANPLLAEVRNHREGLRKLLAEVGVTTASRAKKTTTGKTGGVPVGKLALLQGQAQKRKAG